MLLLSRNVTFQDVPFTNGIRVLLVAVIRSRSQEEVHVQDASDGFVHKGWVWGHGPFLFVIKVCQKQFC